MSDGWWPTSDRARNTWGEGLFPYPLHQEGLVVFPFRELGPLVHLGAGKACRGAVRLGQGAKLSAWRPWTSQSSFVQWLQARDGAMTGICFCVSYWLAGVCGVRPEEDGTSISQAGSHSDKKGRENQFYAFSFFLF